MPQEPAKPDGWEKLRREGDPEGYPEVGHDKKRHQNFTVRRDGSICWHDVPAGFGFRDGILTAKDDAPAQVSGTPERPASIPGVIVANAAGVEGEAPAVTEAAEKGKQL
jgi:hypothetical protein